MIDERVRYFGISYAKEIKSIPPSIVDRGVRYTGIPQIQCCFGIIPDDIIPNQNVAIFTFGKLKPSG